MEVPEASEVRGVRPQDLIDSPMLFTIGIPEGENDTLKETKRKIAKGGEMTQYTLFGKDDNGEWRCIQFLFDRYLQGCRKAYGPNSLSWAGKSVSVGAVKDGEFYRCSITPTVQNAAPIVKKTKIFVLDGEPEANNVGTVTEVRA